MVGSSFRDREGPDPFHMVIRSFDDELAKAMETAWSQAIYIVSDGAKGERICCDVRRGTGLFFLVAACPRAVAHAFA